MRELYSAAEASDSTDERAGAGSMVTGGKPRRRPARAAHGARTPPTSAASDAGSGWSRKRHAASERGQRIVRQRARARLLGKLLAGAVDRDRDVQVRRRAASRAARCRWICRGVDDSRSAPRTTSVIACSRIVDDDRELVREQAVGALARRSRRRRAQGPALAGPAAGRRTRSTRRRRARATRAAGASRAIWRNAVAARARIDALAACAERRRFELAPRARARDTRARARSARASACGVVCRARRLPHDRTVPREAIARERGRIARSAPAAAARLVDVLDAQQPFAAARARIAIARERGDQRAEMQRAGGRGREAAAVRGAGRTYGSRRSTRERRGTADRGAERHVDDERARRSE